MNIKNRTYQLLNPVFVVCEAWWLSRW